MKFIVVASILSAALAAEAPAPAKVKFSQPKLELKKANDITFTVNDACKHDGTVAVDISLAENQQAVGNLYPIKGDGLTFEANKNATATELTKLKVLETDAGKKEAEKYQIIRYNGNTKAHAPFKANFTIFTTGAKGPVNFTVSVLCEHEKKAEVFKSTAKQIDPLTAGSAVAKASFSLLIAACLAALI